MMDICGIENTRYAGVRIGPVVRKDVMRASTMLEHEEKYACILAFDVKVADPTKYYTIWIVICSSSGLMVTCYLGGERCSRDGGQRRSENLPG